VTAVLAWQLREPRQLIVNVGESNEPLAPHARVTTPENTSTPLRFSDGTRVELGPRSAMTVVSLERNDIRLSMETGRAGFNVVHEEHRRWELRAGPFAVNITGTQFAIAWDPAQDSFELALTEGQVELTGCGFGAGRRLAAGQTVRAACRKDTVEITYGTGAIASKAESDASANEASHWSAPASEVASVASGGDVTHERSQLGAATPSPRRTNPNAEWLQLAEQGRYQEALSAVDRSGFALECSRASADELVRVADIARRAHEVAKARQALMAVRQRFSRTNQAGMAAFKLGVLEFDELGAFEKAAFWFRSYLNENPAGPLRREARGRLMEALHRAGSPDARGIAEAYLRDHPTGPHAELAQRIAAGQ
jgi:hypothetical protein